MLATALALMLVALGVRAHTYIRKHNSGIAFVFISQFVWRINICWHNKSFLFVVFGFCSTQAAKTFILASLVEFFVWSKLLISRN